MMKGGLGGGSKKEGKMRIRAFPVNNIFYTYLVVLLKCRCYCFLTFLHKDDNGREICGKHLEFTEECHSGNPEEK